MSGDFCYVGEQHCVAKMLVSELGGTCCPLVVKWGLDYCSPCWPLLRPGCTCYGMLQGEGKGVLSDDRYWNWNPIHRNMLFGLPEMIPRVELPDVSGPPSLSVLQPKSAPRRKCAACKIVVHTTCIAQLEKVCVAVQPSVPSLEC